MDGQYDLSEIISISWEKYEPVFITPNPSTGQVHFSDNQAYRVVVRNLLGQVVFLSEKVNQVDFPNKGIYFVTIWSDRNEVIGYSTLIVE